MITIHSPKIEDRHDVGMAKGRGVPGFPHKSADIGFVRVRLTSVEDLDGDFTL